MHNGKHIKFDADRMSHIKMSSVCVWGYKKYMCGVQGYKCGFIYIDRNHKALFTPHNAKQSLSIIFFNEIG